MGHDLSATASIIQPRRLRFVAYVMAGLVIVLYGFGYVSQYPSSIPVYTNREGSDRLIHRIARSGRHTYNKISVERLRRNRVWTVGRRASGPW